MWSAVARCPAQIWQLEHDLSPVATMERSRGLGNLGRDTRGGHGRELHGLAGGEAADCKACENLVGLPERTPNAWLADKGYDGNAIRVDLGERKIEAVIPDRSNRRMEIVHNRALNKQRNRIERMFGHLKINHVIVIYPRFWRWGDPARGQPLCRLQRLEQVRSRFRRGRRWHVRRYLQWPIVREQR